jgi:hypothetical protein
MASVKCIGSVSNGCMQGRETEAWGLETTLPVTRPF